MYEKLVRNPLENHFLKTPLKWGINNPMEKLAVGADFQPWRLAVDRPDRPLPGTENRVLCRSTGAFQRAEALCGRPWSVDRPSNRLGVHVL